MDGQAGISRRESHNLAAKGGVRHPDLVNPTDCPEALEYLLGYFNDLSDSRQHSAMTGMPLPLSAVEIRFWEEMSRIKLDLAEYKIIKSLDKTYRAVHSKFLAERYSK